MPISNGTGTFSTGRDCRIVLRTPFGKAIIPNVTQFDLKQETSEIKVSRLDGVKLQAFIPNGWSWNIEAERGSVNMDSIIAQMEAAWYTAGTIGGCALYQYVTEIGGNSRWQMDAVTIKLEEAGTWKGDTSVKQKLAGWANRRIQF